MSRQLRPFVMLLIAGHLVDDIPGMARRKPLSRDPSHYFIELRLIGCRIKSIGTCFHQMGYGFPFPFSVIEFFQALLSEVPAQAPLPEICIYAGPTLIPSLALHNDISRQNAIIEQAPFKQRGNDLARDIRSKSLLVKIRFDLSNRSWP